MPRERYYGKDEEAEYNKLRNALRTITDETKPYPVDIQVSVAQVNRDGVIKSFDHRHSCNLMKESTFSFSIGGGGIYILFVDDHWYWMHESSVPLCKKMATYENTRRAYLTDKVALLTESKQGQYDKVETAARLKELAEKHEKRLFTAIEQFMGIRVMLPPAPMQPLEGDTSNRRNARYKNIRPRSTREDTDSRDSEIFACQGTLMHKNRFDEYAKERLQLKSDKGWKKTSVEPSSKTGISITGNSREKMSITGKPQKKLSLTGK